jgi:hypothetical protein
MHATSRKRLLGAAFASIAAIWIAPASAADRAAVLLKAMSDYLGAQPSIAASFDGSMEIVTNDLEKIQFNSSGDFLLVRPDKLRISRKGGFSDVELRYDGKTAGLLGKNAGVFAEVEAPGTVDQLLKAIEDQYSITLPGADLLVSNVFSAVSENIIEGKYIGPDVISGVTCDHLAFRSDGLDWQLWIEANGDPIPCKLVITNKTASGAPQYTIQFSKWQAKPSVAADSFTFAPPPDGKKLALQDFASATDMDEIPPHIGAVEKPAGDGEKQ